MHIIRPPFRMSDEEAIAFAAQRGFGVAIPADADGPRGSHVPFTIRQSKESLSPSSI